MRLSTFARYVVYDAENHCRLCNTLSEASTVASASCASSGDDIYVYSFVSRRTVVYSLVGSSVEVFDVH